jgi:hypothetical protein
MALEILSSENPELCNTLVSHPCYFEMIWHVLETSEVLDPMKANALVRIISALLSKNFKEVTKSSIEI